jgi:3-methyladenine DNA glycosylase AlkD
MNPDDIAAEIRQRIHARGDWNTADLRKLRRELTRRLVTTDAPFLLELALLLVAKSEADFLPRFMAYELVAHHAAALSGLRARDVEALGRGLDRWEAVDTFACYISGPAWRNRQLSDALIHRWSHSPDRWWRRAALVSTVPLNCKARGGHGDTPRTLAMCSRLLEDRDDMVVKAMSWALRELAKRDAPAVEDFLANHGQKLASRVIREVRNKLLTGLKNPRRA